MSSSEDLYQLERDFEENKKRNLKYIFLKSEALDFLKLRFRKYAGCSIAVVRVLWEHVV